MQTAIDIVIPVFVVLTMLELGVTVPVEETVRGFRDPRTLWVGSLLNLLVIPAVGLTIVKAFDLPQALEYGLLLTALSPAAPVVLKIMEFARLDRGRWIGLVVILQLIGAIIVPLEAGLLLSSEADINQLGLLATVVSLQIVPLAVGMLWRTRTGARTTIVGQRVAAASTFAFALLVALVVINDLAEFASLLEPQTVTAMLLLLASSLLIGSLFGGGDPNLRRGFALICAARKGGLALIIAQGAFSAESPVIVMVVAYALLELVALTSLAGIWGWGFIRRTAGDHA